MNPGDGATEAVVTRVVHLGFEVRVDMELRDKTQARAQLTRQQAEELELCDGDLVYVTAERKEKAPAAA